MRKTGHHDALDVAQDNFQQPWARQRECNFTVSIYDSSTVRIPGLKRRKRGVHHDAFDGAQDNLWQLWAWQRELQALGQHCQGLRLLNLVLVLLQLKASIAANC